MLTTKASEEAKTFQRQERELETGTTGQKRSLPPGILSSLTLKATSSTEKTCIILIVTEQTESATDQFLN